MPDKRDRRAVTHMRVFVLDNQDVLSATLCRTRAALPPMVAWNLSDVTCKRCRHLGGIHTEKVEAR